MAIFVLKRDVKLQLTHSSSPVLSENYAGNSLRNFGARREQWYVVAMGLGEAGVTTREDGPINSRYDCTLCLVKGSPT